MHTWLAQATVTRDGPCLGKLGMKCPYCEQRFEAEFNQLSMETLWVNFRDHMDASHAEI